jgi:hypothetical protein
MRGCTDGCWPRYLPLVIRPCPIRTIVAQIDIKVTPPHMHSQRPFKHIRRCVHVQCPLRRERIYIPLDRHIHHHTRPKQPTRRRVQEDLAQTHRSRGDDEIHIVHLRSSSRRTRRHLHTSRRSFLDQLYGPPEALGALAVAGALLDVVRGDLEPFRGRTDMFPVVDVDRPRGRITGFPFAADQGAADEAVEGRAGPAVFGGDVVPRPVCRLEGWSVLVIELTGRT